MAVGTIQVKVCGMRDPGLAQFALECGTDFIGMIHHHASPRHVELEAMKTLCGELPESTRVGVVVQPDESLVNRIWDTGVDVLQVHLKRWDRPTLELLHNAMPSGKSLWLAPKLAPGSDFPSEILDFCSRVLIDTYSKHCEGGTGQTGDWDGFRELCNEFPHRNFILAGGLNAGNIGDAILQSGTKMVDVSSALEVSPGVKSLESIDLFFRTLNTIAKA